MTMCTSHALCVTYTYVNNKCTLSSKHMDGNLAFTKYPSPEERLYSGMLICIPLLIFVFPENFLFSPFGQMCYTIVIIVVFVIRNVDAVDIIIDITLSLYFQRMVCFFSVHLAKCVKQL